MGIIDRAVRVTAALVFIVAGLMPRRNAAQSAATATTPVSAPPSEAYTMAARRCSSCSRNYPAGTADCPICGTPCWYSPSSTPMSDEELAALTAHGDFERWLLTPEGIEAERKARETNDWLEAELRFEEAT